MLSPVEILALYFTIGALKSNPKWDPSRHNYSFPELVSRLVGYAFKDEQCGRFFIKSKTLQGKKAVHDQGANSLVRRMKYLEHTLLGVPRIFIESFQHSYKPPPYDPNADARRKSKSATRVYAVLIRDKISRDFQTPIYFI